MPEDIEDLPLGSVLHLHQDFLDRPQTIELRGTANVTLVDRGDGSYSVVETPEGRRFKIQHRQLERAVTSVDLPSATEVPDGNGSDE
jgi:hypothetical protein